jgi:hypothetical protein
LIFLRDNFSHDTLPVTANANRGTVFVRANKVPKTGSFRAIAEINAAPLFSEHVIGM